MSDPQQKYHSWQEISDIPADIERLRDRELEALSGVWAREKEQVVDSRRFADFNQQLAREWAIETGIIENVYTLDRGITQTLIERGIDSAFIPHGATNADPELVARIIRAHNDVLEGLFSFVNGERALSTGYIKELHAALLRYQETVAVFDTNGRPFQIPLQKGAYKSFPNNPLRSDGTLHEYCPPEHTASEMDRLVELYQSHVARNVHPSVEAAWLHHAFTQIHPFQDGNGRVARSLATLVYVKNGLFPLVITRDDREQYIDALEVADQGDLSHLTRLFSRSQKRALTSAIGGAFELKPAKSIDEAVEVTRDMLVDLGRISRSEYLETKRVASILVKVTDDRFGKLAEKLLSEITRVDSSYAFSHGQVGPPPPLDDIRSVAAQLRYEPDASVYYQAPVFVLKVGEAESQIVISFHGVGTAFKGVLVAVGYFKSHTLAVTPVCEDVFRINYQEPQDEVLSRFDSWLESCIIEGLAHWRRTFV